MTTSVAMTCSPCSLVWTRPKPISRTRLRACRRPPVHPWPPGLLNRCAREISVSRKRVAFSDWPHWCLFCSWPPLGSCSRNSRAH